MRLLRGRGSAAAGTVTGAWRRWRCVAWVAVLLALPLLDRSLGPRAWDSDRLTQAAVVQGPRAVALLNELLPLLVSLRGAGEPAQLQAVNAFFNRRILFQDDTDVWGQNDYWASPLETLGKGRGDCEDYVIAKYFSLLALGVPSAKLRLIYVRAQLGGPGGPSTPHMVLAWYAAPGAEPLILDNLITDLRPASRRPDLDPVFSFSADGLWPGAAQTSAGDPSERLSRWRVVLAKARAEGWL